MNCANPIAQDVLDTASRCINGERAGDYGPAIENFSRIAAMWTALSPNRQAFTPHDVALFMSCVKLARLVNTPGHKDSLVDLCGYAALGAQVFQDRKFNLVDTPEEMETLEAILAADGFSDPDYDDWAASVSGEEKDA